MLSSMYLLLSARDQGILDTRAKDTGRSVVQDFGPSIICEGLTFIAEHYIT